MHIFTTFHLILNFVWTNFISYKLKGIVDCFLNGYIKLTINHLLWFPDVCFLTGLSGIMAICSVKKGDTRHTCVLYFKFCYFQFSWYFLFLCSLYEDNNIPLKKLNMNFKKYV